MIGRDLQEAIEAACPDVDPQIRRDFLSRMDEDYFSLFSPEEIGAHLRMSRDLDHEHPVQIKVIPRGDDRFDLLIVAHDYFSEFSTICGLLVSFGLDIQTGHIYTSSPKAPEAGRASRLRGGGTRRIKRAVSFPQKIVDVFNVRLRPGETFDVSRERDLEQELQALIRLLAEDQFQEVRERVNRRMVEHLEKVKGQFTGRLYPIEVRFDNHLSEKWTVMDVHSKDISGFLYAFSNALSMRGIYIYKVHIQSIGTEVRDRFYISDRQGRKIEGEREQQALRVAVVLIKQFTHFLQSAPDPARAIQHFDQLLDKIMEGGAERPAVSLFKKEEGLEILAQLLGTSDFLWEDFLRMQFENLLPVLEDVKRKKLKPGKKAIDQELVALLDRGSTYEEKKKILNEFKDREMFFIDMKHLVDPKVTLMGFSHSLTDLAEVVLDRAYPVCRDHLAEQYGRPILEDGKECPFSICGLGKFGGREMGYASDIELLFIYGGPGRTQGGNSIENGRYFEQLVQELMNFIETRQEGIFHMDPRLRPHGSAGPLANPIEQLMAYYSPSGQAAPFERQTLIKLRRVAGDESLGRKVEAYRDRYVYSGEPWNLEEALHLRSRQMHELVKPGLMNVKYSAGGIIDIEYEVQYLQILHGGDHPELRVPSTAEALDQLCRLGIIPKKERDDLYDGYLFLRTLIDAMRMVKGSARDLVLPEETSEEFKFLARRMGYREPDWEKGAMKLSEDIRYHLENVHRYFEGRFHPAKTGETHSSA
jgi:[glutamine synthetase] adenylyltransferase / [glutamine synthetase]-adenylyl-L-tyrosine phosphorylase